MNGILAQIISMFSFGMSNALWRKPINKLIAEEAIVYRTVFTILFFSILLMFLGETTFMVSEKAFGMNMWVFTFLVSCLSYFGLFFFNKALKCASTGFVVIVTTTTFLFGQFTAFFILEESPELLYLLAFGLFLFSIVLADYKSFIKLKFSKGIVYGLLASLFWGVTFPLLSIPSKALGYIQTGLILEISVMAMSLLSLYLIQKKRVNFSHFKAHLKFFVLLGFFAGNGVLFNNLSYTKIPVYIAGAISSSTHFVTIFIAWVLFKEKIKPHQFGAALLAGFSIYYITTIL